MKYRFKILRQKSSKEEAFWQSFELETDIESATVATALTLLNQKEPLLTTEGEEAEKILWDCSCLQKKCGACAMVICGRPGLACNVRLNEMKAGQIVLEPLHKFPVIADLMVDRTILFDNLQTIGAWLEQDQGISDVSLFEDQSEFLYEASRCLQCGCCLEVCPNFYSGGTFFGMSAMVPAARLLEELAHKKKDALRKEYRKHVYEGCGKSLACRNICPAGIDMERLLSRSNAVAAWRFLLSLKFPK